jgi:hypothetical protein
MVGKEVENRGMIEKYKGFNKLTRNISLGIGGGALLLGSGGVAAVALGAAAFDQGQIVLIEKWQKRKKENGIKRGFEKSGVVVDFRKAA